MSRTLERLEHSDRVVITLAVTFACNISAQMERRIRGDERARVVERLHAIGIFALSREPSYRRLAGKPYPDVDTLVAELRRDERQLMTRELRREARLSFALESDDLEFAAAQVESGTL